MSNFEWVALAIPVVSSVLHYGYKYFYDRQAARFLWRIYEASSFSDRHLRAAAEALRIAKGDGLDRGRTSRASLRRR